MKKKTKLFETEIRKIEEGLAEIKKKASRYSEEEIEEIKQKIREMNYAEKAPDPDVKYVAVVTFIIDGIVAEDFKEAQNIALRNINADIKPHDLMVNISRNYENYKKLKDSHI